MGEAGMLDRSSRPHHSPNKTPRRLVRKVVHLRWKKRLGPVGIGAQLGMPASTVHTVLSRCRINRPSHVDVRTGEPARRYEHEHPGSMIHVDIKKLGNIPDGGGWRYVGRLQGERNKAITAKRTGKHGITGDMITGTAFADGWAYARHYNSESARRNALPAWLHSYNHHRPHTAIGSQPPISRLTNVPEKHS
ncbi:transposase, ISlxx4 [Leifsonia xyli subsp. cynodontis DSM 46306]|uniref:Integrase catalytic domain-containing protein n=1 Tax=Leifsonia xyli subsp. cynodontis DSM 46306 TaxID=1389489 RepID=U3P9B3_LEIXC|nr:transposase, ISlxx4 [Leifsonia xyli subsp. cynodontis DSM 46306]